MAQTLGCATNWRCAYLRENTVYGEMCEALTNSEVRVLCWSQSEIGRLAKFIHLQFVCCIMIANVEDHSLNHFCVHPRFGFTFVGPNLRWTQKLSTLWSCCCAWATKQIPEVAVSPACLDRRNQWSLKGELNWGDALIYSNTTEKC